METIGEVGKTREEAGPGPVWEDKEPKGARTILYPPTEEASPIRISFHQYMQVVDALRNACDSATALNMLHQVIGRLVIDDNRQGW